MKIIHKTLDNERIAMMLDILRRNLGEEFNADKLVIYVDGGQVIFTHPSTEEGEVTCRAAGTDLLTPEQMILGG